MEQINGNMAAAQPQQPVVPVVQEQKRPQSNTELMRRYLSNDEIVGTFKRALGKHSDSFVASVIEMYNTDAALKSCEPKLVIQEALKAATLQLPINKQLGFAYIIAFNNRKKDANGNWYSVTEPTFQIGYKGFIQLAMRSGQYEILNSDIVYEGELRSKNKLTGEIDFGGERKEDAKVVGYFCHERLVNGFSKTLYMTVEEVAAHAKRFSKSIQNNKGVTVQSLIELASLPFDPNSKETGWIGNFHSMALKTVTRALLSKYGYLSIEMSDAISSDIKGDVSLDINEPPLSPSEDVTNKENIDRARQLAERYRKKTKQEEGENPSSDTLFDQQ